MKKTIKILICLIIIISTSYIVRCYNNQIKEFLTDITVSVKNNITGDSEDIYSEEEIKRLLKSSKDTVVDGEYIGKLDNYYYEQLDVYSKIIYKSILDNIDKIETGNYEIKLSNNLSNAMKEANGKEVINLSFQNAWSAFRLDHPEVFCVNVENIYLTTKAITIGKKTTYEFFLNNKENSNNQKNATYSVKNRTDQVTKKKEEIIKDIPSDSSSFVKALYIHNWLIDNIDYDINMQNNNNNNIYGAIVENKVVCEGYAKAYKYLLDELEVPCVIICGDVTDENGDTQKHAWNAVYIEGNWYAVDTTWDDPIIIGKGKITNDLKYKYFLKGSTEIEKNHKQIGRLSEDIKEIEFNYPILNVVDYKN